MRFLQRLLLLLRYQFRATRSIEVLFRELTCFLAKEHGCDSYFAEAIGKGDSLLGSGHFPHMRLYRMCIQFLFAAPE
jgi:hypothetical protein